MLRLYVNECYTIMIYISIGNEDNMKSIVHSNYQLSKINYAAAAYSKYVNFDNYSLCDGQNSTETVARKRSPAQKLAIL